MTNKKIILQTKNLTKTFPSGNQQLTVLDNIDFELAEGETVSLVGHSGSGKSTFLGLCAGLDKPTSGQIFFENQDLSRKSEEELALWRIENVGFVFQTFRLISTLTALENVMVPAELKNNKEAASLAEELLTQVGLEDRLHHTPVQLSGGEQQRVALARAFINRPRILFADEPTGNLDDKNADKINELIFDMNRQWKTTLMMVTHNPDLAQKTNRQYHFDHGRLSL